MHQAEFDRVAASFATFHHYFAPLFGRPEAQGRAKQYVQGLLVQQTDRRNCENLAEAVEGATPRAFQKLLTESPWAWELVQARLQAFVGERLNTPDGEVVVDDTGFGKQGTQSVGVARQYSGTLGWESRHGLPGRACWLVLRRNLDGSERKYYLSKAPAATPLPRLGEVGPCDGRSRSSSRPTRGRAAWTSTRCGAGRAGTTTSP